MRLSGRNWENVDHEVDQKMKRYWLNLAEKSETLHTETGKWDNIIMCHESLVRSPCPIFSYFLVMLWGHLENISGDIFYCGILWNWHVLKMRKLINYFPCSPELNLIFKRDKGWWRQGQVVQRSNLIIIANPSHLQPRKPIWLIGLPFHLTLLDLSSKERGNIATDICNLYL